MTTYVPIGYGVTDETGVAKLDHDMSGNTLSHSYTGTGAGEVDIVSSLDDPTEISSSSVQSVPFEVLDAKAIQTTIQGNASLRANSTITGTTLDLSTNGTSEGLLYFANSSGTSYQIAVGDCVQFNIIEYTGVVRLRLDGTSNYEVLYLSSAYTQTNLIQLVNNGTNVLVYADGQLVYTSPSITSETRTFKIRLDTGATIKLKDLLAYPI